MNKKDHLELQDNKNSTIRSVINFPLIFMGNVKITKK